MKAFKRKVFSFFIAYVGKYLLRLILMSCKLKVIGLESYKKIAAKERCILMLWHNRLSIVSEILFKLDKVNIFAAFISKSRDGDPLAILANSYKIGKAIRVPHDRKHQALKSLIDTLKNSNEIVVITPDGPRGPRYEVKPGIVMAGVQTNAAIIPFTWSSTSFWQLKSWDKLMFPKPFSTIVVTFGESIKLVTESSRENQDMLRDRLLQIETRVNDSLFKAKEQWPK